MNTVNTTTATRTKKKTDETRGTASSGAAPLKGTPKDAAKAKNDAAEEKRRAAAARRSRVAALKVVIERLNMKEAVYKGRKIGGWDAEFLFLARTGGRLYTKEQIQCGDNPHLRAVLHFCEVEAENAGGRPWLNLIERHMLTVVPKKEMVEPLQYDIDQYGLAANYTDKILRPCFWLAHATASALIAADVKRDFQILERLYSRGWRPKDDRDRDAAISRERGPATATAAALQPYIGLYADALCGLRAAVEGIRGKMEDWTMGFMLIPKNAAIMIHRSEEECFARNFPKHLLEAAPRFAGAVADEKELKAFIRDYENGTTWRGRHQRVARQTVEKRE